ncbi:MotE family protein [Amphibacillus cookii]|uniref:MotE family protein n=1 Tax=Amphibacillus cookii TaxID=767787 RepID=UPI001956B5C8|nr:hypothetical protein [Amphibacillus cookii]MBM7540573.1 flagellar motility protein MotE (MotC chaperone) [Amphibacillus cookii]
MADPSTTKKEKKKTNVLQWLFLILVPLVLAIVILFIVLSMLGMDPIGKTKAFANSIPVVSNWVTTDEEAEIERKQRQYESKIESLEEEITAMESDLSSKNSEIDHLNQEIVRLTAQIEDSIEEDGEDETEVENLAKLIESYDEMNPANAAVILSNSSNQVALAILQEIDDAHRADILSAMDPEQAATFTEQLLD